MPKLFSYAYLSISSGLIIALISCRSPPITHLSRSKPYLFEIRAFLSATFDTWTYVLYLPLIKSRFFTSVRISPLSVSVLNYQVSFTFPSSTTDKYIYCSSFGDNNQIISFDHMGNFETLLVQIPFS